MNNLIDYSRDVIKINEKFQPLWDEQFRYFLITGGRNSSKSFSTNVWGVQKTFQPGNKALHTRYTMKSAWLSIIPEFEEKIDLMNARDCFNINKTDITNNRTGSQIIFSGIKTSAGNQTASLKSLQAINMWIMDEAEELENEKDFKKIDYSIRQKSKKNTIVIILNPATKEHWIWKRWFEGHLKYINIDGFQIPVSTHPEICHIHTTYLDNIENIPEDYLRIISNMKRDDPEQYKHVILGGWLEKAEGVIFTNWEEGKFDDSLPYGYGLDFGFINPDALTKVAIDKRKKQIYIKQELYESGLGSNELERRLIGICGRKEIVADCADSRLIDDLGKSLNISKAIKEAGSVLAGIKIMKGYRLIIDPNSEDLKIELNNYAWENKKGEVPRKKYDHLLDGARYKIYKSLKGEFEGVW